MQRALAESQMKENRIAILNEIVSSKESLLDKLGEESSKMTQKLEAMESDKQKYMAKVETILQE